MSKKSFDMSSLLATKGDGAPSKDAPKRQIVQHAEILDAENRQNKENNSPSSEFVNLGFKVPKEFRHKLRKIAAHNDISLVELLRSAIELYEREYMKLK